MSDGATPKLKEFARRLLRFEAVSSKSAGADDFAAFRTCEKLGGPLGKLMGPGGYRALLSRALSLAGADAPWLGKLFLKEDSSLEGFAAVRKELGSKAITEGEVALVAQLLGLLVTFIGPALTLGLVQEGWPKADFNDLDFGTNEKP